MIMAMYFTIRKKSFVKSHYNVKKIKIQHY